MAQMKCKTGRAYFYLFETSVLKIEKQHINVPERFRLSQRDKEKLYYSVVRYGLYNELPDWDDPSWGENASACFHVFQDAIIEIDDTHARRVINLQNGKKGGRPARADVPAPESPERNSKTIYSDDFIPLPENRIEIKIVDDEAESSKPEVDTSKPEERTAKPESKSRTPEVDAGKPEEKRDEKTIQINGFKNETEKNRNAVSVLKPKPKIENGFENKTDPKPKRDFGFETKTEPKPTENRNEYEYEFECEDEFEAEFEEEDEFEDENEEEAEFEDEFETESVAMPCGTATLEKEPEKELDAEPDANLRPNLSPTASVESASEKADAPLCPESFRRQPVLGYALKDEVEEKQNVKHPGKIMLKTNEVLSKYFYDRNKGWADNDKDLEFSAMNSLSKKIFDLGSFETHSEVVAAVFCKSFDKLFAGEYADLQCLPSVCNRPGFWLRAFLESRRTLATKATNKRWEEQELYAREAVRQERLVYGPQGFYAFMCAKLGVDATRAGWFERLRKALRAEESAKGSAERQ